MRTLGLALRHIPAAYFRRHNFRRLSRTPSCGQGSGGRKTNFCITDACQRPPISAMMPRDRSKELAGILIHKAAQGLRKSAFPRKWQRARIRPNCGSEFLQNWIVPSRSADARLAIAEMARAQGDSAAHATDARNVPEVPTANDIDATTHSNCNCYSRIKIMAGAGTAKDSLSGRAHEPHMVTSSRSIGSRTIVGCFQQELADRFS